MKFKRIILNVIALVLILTILTSSVIFAAWEYKFPIYVTDTSATLINDTGEVTGSPISLLNGANLITVTVLGDLTINLPFGATGIATSGTTTIAGSPVALVVGSQTVTAGVATGTFTVTLNLPLTRNYYPVNLGGGGIPLINTGKINNDALDTNMQIGSTNIEYMIAGDRIMTAIPSLPVNGAVEADLYTGYSPAQTSMPVIVGDSGYVTTLDIAALEPASNQFRITTDGYIDTQAGTNKYIVYKNAALYVENDAAGSITADFNGSPTTVTGVTSGEQTVSVGTSAIRLDGANQLVSVPYNTQMLLGNSDFTISMWVYIENVALNQGLVLFGSDINNYFQIWYDSVFGLWWNVVSGGVGLMVNNGAFAPVNNTWYNLIFQRSGNNWSIYADGALLNTVVSADAVPDYGVGVPYRFGESLTLYLGGRMQDIRWLKRAIIAGEIADYQTCTYTDDTDLELFLPCVQDSGTTVDDYSGNNLDGTAIPGCSWTQGLYDYLMIDDVFEGHVIPSVAIPGNANNWLWMQNNVEPYSNYIVMVINGVEVLEYRPDFMIGSTDYSVGTATFTQGSNAVLGIGTAFDNSLLGGLIKPDAGTDYYIVASVTDSTHLVLDEVYAPATAAGAAYHIYKDRVQELDNRVSYGAITWGTNTSVTITYGEMVSSGSSTAPDSGVSGLDVQDALMPSTWFANGANVVNLPFYDSFSEVASQTGQPVVVIYFMGFIGLAFGTFLLLTMTTRSALLGALGFNVVLFIGSSTTVVAMWIPFATMITMFGIMYLYKQVAY
jgi:hypothetical protein